MKKIILFVALATLGMSLNSCSSDDSGSSTQGGTITVKIDGVSTTFDNVIVNAETFEDGGETYTSLDVTATKGTSTSEIITFYTEKGEVGADKIWSFTYVKNGEQYNSNGELTTVIQTNGNDQKLTGSFSGTVSYYDGGNVQEVVLTDGSFNIKY